MMIEYDIAFVPEAAPVRGNAMFTDSPDFNRIVEDRILADIDGGNPWAWVSVRYTASIDGIRCSAYRDCCSFASEYGFRQSSAFLDMREDVVEQLRQEIEARLRTVDDAEEVLRCDRSAYEDRQQILIVKKGGCDG